MITLKRKNNIIFTGIVIYILSVLTFFSPVFINNTLLKAVSFGIMFFGFALAIVEIFPKKHTKSAYSKSIKWIIVLGIISVIMGYIQHQQSILVNIRMMLDVVPFAFFFILKKYNYQLDTTERLIKVISKIYCVLFVIALIAAPLILFDKSGGKVQEINIGRGVARVKLAGSCFLHFHFFLAINNWLTKKRKVDMFWVVITFVFIVLEVSRQHIVVAFILGFLMISQNVNWFYKILVISFTLLLVKFAVNNITVVQNLIELTTDQVNETGTENIRILAFEEYMFNHNTNVLQDIFGNGIPNENSSWGKQYNRFREVTGLIPSDVGFAKIFFYFGTLGLLVFLLLGFKVLSKKVPPQIQYAKFYVTFVYLTNIASHGIFTEAITLTIALYILDFYNKKYV
ncbi:hypothetical protein [Wenyingzhuangia aestuarii]|uniref:hypothetical protein n=1 Tax=Wenyingzhuangia aestuarii TaxID=1647582 RepID=UPI001439B539|nr:hypothetical protein [Wenyingzhuangia aestuarii]NJB83256.1 hypothetical protein [Wenyingzhuangia aestuarii]